MAANVDCEITPRTDIPCERNLKGTHVASKIVPNGLFPTHDQIFGKGGYKLVKTVEELKLIPESRLTEGEICIVTDIDQFYKWNGSEWQCFDILTKEDLENYYTKSESDNRFLTELKADNKYQPKGDYQPRGNYLPAGNYALKSELPDLTGYATKEWVDTNYLLKSAADKIEICKYKISKDSSVLEDLPWKVSADKKLLWGTCTTLSELLFNTYPIWSTPILIDEYLEEGETPTPDPEPELEFPSGSITFTALNKNIDYISKLWVEPWGSEFTAQDGGPASIISGFLVLFIFSKYDNTTTMPPGIVDDTTGYIKVQGERNNFLVEQTTGAVGALFLWQHIETNYPSLNACITKTIDLRSLLNNESFINLILSDRINSPNDLRNATTPYNGNNYRSQLVNLRRDLVSINNKLNPFLNPSLIYSWINGTEGVSKYVPVPWLYNNDNLVSTIELINTDSEPSSISDPIDPISYIEWWINFMLLQCMNDIYYNYNNPGIANSAYHYLTCMLVDTQSNNSERDAKYILKENLWPFKGEIS